jgi:hypothetical protein
METNNRDRQSPVSLRWFWLFTAMTGHLHPCYSVSKRTGSDGLDFCCLTIGSSTMATAVRLNGLFAMKRGEVPLTP